MPLDAFTDIARELVTTNVFSNVFENVLKDLQAALAPLVHAAVSKHLSPVTSGPFTAVSGVKDTPALANTAVPRHFLDFAIKHWTNEQGINIKHSRQQRGNVSLRARLLLASVATTLL